MAGLFSKPKAAEVALPTPPPEPPPPAPMPDPDDVRAKAMTKRKVASAQSRRGGRASTIMSDVGGGGTSLGAA